MLVSTIRNPYSHNENKPRLMDFIIDDEGMALIAVKIGKTRHVILLQDAIRQVEQQIPGIKIRFSLKQ